MEATMTHMDEKALAIARGANPGRRLEELGSSTVGKVTVYEYAVDGDYDFLVAINTETGESATGYSTVDGIASLLASLIS